MKIFTSINISIGWLFIFFIIRHCSHYSCPSSRENSGREQTDSSDEIRKECSHRKEHSHRKGEYNSSSSGDKLYNENKDDYGDSTPMDVKEGEEYRVPLALLHRSISVSKGKTVFKTSSRFLNFLDNHKYFNRFCITTNNLKYS